jgi:hypothetical protein
MRVPTTNVKAIAPGPRPGKAARKPAEPFWLADEPWPQPPPGGRLQADPDDDAGLGLAILRGLAWAAAGVCAIVGASILAGMAVVYLLRLLP